jgi:uncharacterized LabA/DUF88 family protein
VSPSHAESLLAEITKYGVASVKRVYGDWSSDNLKGWRDVANSLSIQPSGQFSYTRGKNATDIAMIIDAMDLLHTGIYDGFCLASSDSDFTRLASRLRESGVTVYGFGERKTPEAFRNACDQFTYFDVMDESTEERSEQGPTKVPPANLKQNASLVKALRSSVEAASDEEGWAHLGGVGSIMRKQQPDFDSRNWGYAKLSDLVKAIGLFTVDTTTGSVRIKNKKR